ncbi:MAG TPA: Ig-like domain-containing protein [Actinocrinis sp.]|jgi:hypothetical protein
MTRAFIRAVVISAIGGLAIAPALASAADGTPTTTKTPTVTMLTAPQTPQADQEITLMARVGVHTDAGNGDPGGPGAPGTERGEPGRYGTQAKGDHSGKGSPEGGIRKGKGKTKTKGKGKHKGTGRRHTGETGTITFTVDGKDLRPVPLSHDRASEKVELPSGSHTITAAYGGDDNYSPSQAEPLTFTVS